MKSKTITVGAWEIASGPNAGFIATTDAVRALFDTWNAKGGVNGWKIKYVSPDDGGNATLALQDVKNEINNKQVFALVWGPGSPENQIVVPYVAGTSTPYVPPGESGDQFIGHTYKNIFATISPYSAQADYLASYAIKTLGLKKIALAYEDDAVGQPVQQQFAAAVKALGGTLVATASYQATDTNLTAVGQTLAAANPQAVINWGTATPTVLAKQAMMAAGVDVPWFNPYFLADPGVIGLNPTVMEGTYYDSYLEPFYATTPAVNAYKAAMTKYYPKISDGGLAENGWAGAQVFVAGLQAITAGGKMPTQAGLIKAIGKFGKRTIGVLPGLDYTSTNHQGGGEAYVVQYKAGAFHTVAGPSALPSSK